MKRCRADEDRAGEDMSHGMQEVITWCRRVLQQIEIFPVLQAVADGLEPDRGVQPILRSVSGRITQVINAVNGAGPLTDECLLR